MRLIPRISYHALIAGLCCALGAGKILFLLIPARDRDMCKVSRRGATILLQLSAGSFCHGLHAASTVTWLVEPPRDEAMIHVQILVTIIGPPEALKLEHITTYTFNNHYIICSIILRRVPIQEDRRVGALSCLAQPLQRSLWIRGYPPQRHRKELETPSTRGIKSSLASHRTGTAKRSVHQIVKGGTNPIE